MANKIDLLMLGLPGDRGRRSRAARQPTSPTDETPAALRESVNLVERAKRAAIYTIMKGAMKFMSTMEEEQEFLEYAANQLITLYAMDSAVARALRPCRQGGVDAHTHELLAQVAVLRLLPETQAAMEGALTMAFEGDERRAGAGEGSRLPRRPGGEHRARCSASWPGSSPRRAPIRCRATSSRLSPLSYEERAIADCRALGCGASDSPH